MRAMRLKASSELGRRVAIAKTSTYEVITSDSDVVRIMEPQLGSLQHEECWALYLASSGRILERMRISQGGVQATVVDCKLIISERWNCLLHRLFLFTTTPREVLSPAVRIWSLRSVLRRRQSSSICVFWTMSASPTARTTPSVQRV